MGAGRGKCGWTRKVISQVTVPTGYPLTVNALRTACNQSTSRDPVVDYGDQTVEFADRNRFASWTGTAPLDASSGERDRHRLSRAGNRRVNHVIHIAAVTQLRLNTDERA